MTGRVAVIVQARHGSTRLPGKVLKRLAGDTVLAHVLRRCAAVEGADVVCCAIPDGADCEAVAAEALTCGAEVFRGSESDVLDRYHGAAQALGADTVMRVTSDCPLIDPAVCAALLALYEAEDVDYACNNAPPSWPHGLDCEVFSAAALGRAAKAAVSPREREHVTPWLRENPAVTRANLDGPGGAMASLRWTLDYPVDLVFFQALFALLPAGPEIPGWADIAALLQDNPAIAAINAGAQQRRQA